MSSEIYKEEKGRLMPGIKEVVIGFIIGILMDDLEIASIHCKGSSCFVLLSLLK